MGFPCGEEEDAAYMGQHWLVQAGLEGHEGSVERWVEQRRLGSEGRRRCSLRSAASQECACGAARHIHWRLPVELQGSRVWLLRQPRGDVEEGVPASDRQSGQLQPE